MMFYASAHLGAQTLILLKGLRQLKAHYTAQKNHPNQAG